MSKQLFIDESGFVRGYAEIHDGVETANFDAEYAELMSHRPSKNHVYNVDSQQWVYELPVEEQQGYTAEQLEQMTAAELKAICAEMGISGTMTKANMIVLILGKQDKLS